MARVLDFVDPEPGARAPNPYHISIPMWLFIILAVAIIGVGLLLSFQP